MFMRQKPSVCPSPSLPLPELEEMSGEFVHGFIQALDMEKDPRNLILAFQCVETICHNLSLGKQDCI